MSVLHVLDVLKGNTEFSGCVLLIRFMLWFLNSASEWVCLSFMEKVCPLTSVCVFLFISLSFCFLTFFFPLISPCLSLSLFHYISLLSFLPLLVYFTCSYWLHPVAMDPHPSCTRCPCGGLGSATSSYRPTNMAKASCSETHTGIYTDMTKAFYATGVYISMVKRPAKTPT